MSRRGLALYASSCDNLWPALLALQPAALVVMDAYHLPPALGAVPYFLWRPWLPGTMRDRTPQEWKDTVVREWAAKGCHPFHGIQFLNEPNLQSESGYPDGSHEAADAVNAWGLAVVDLLRDAWPGVDVHSPPLSPHVPGWETFYSWLEPLIDACDVLNVHTYLDMPRSYEAPHRLYSSWPLVISECGDRGNGSGAYALALTRWLNGLPEYVEWAACFVYQQTPEFAEWSLAGTVAEKVLIEAGG